MTVSRDYLESILKAEVYRVARETSLDRAERLSRRLGCEVLLKREDQQPTFSFKLRGAYNRIARLAPDQRAHGVMAASAGNHAQGVALAAGILGCDAAIVMPATTPTIKVDAVRQLGAAVTLFGDSYAEAELHALELCARDGRVFVHPYDDPDIIAGQGTIGVELLRQHPAAIDAIFVPVGGGGLISGIAAYVKCLRPEIRMIGVEPAGAASMRASLDAGRPVALDHVELFVDGVAVKKVGTETFRLCRELVDDVILVDDDATCAAIKDVFEDTRSILEPAGALSIAGLKAWAERAVAAGSGRGATLIAIASGANVNFDRLRYISEVAEIGEQREALLGVKIPERPGTLKSFCALIGQRSITEFNYRYADASAAHIFVGVTVDGRAETAALATELAVNGFAVSDFSGDDTAKLHVRHMVGGRAPQARDELLYRFEFPERRGALMRFLDSMSQGWNISLFHYRSDGSEYGHVLAGLQVPPAERGELRAFLDRLGYAYHDESDNPAYRMFLA